ncbi:MAG: MotA/TolQ/ExbB proton channel family protein [Chitinophagales bacterium]
MLNTIFLQSIDNGGAEEVAQESMQLISLIMKGGYIMIPIGVLSIIAIYIFVERYLTIKKASKIDPKFMLNIKDYVANGNIEAAKTLSKNTDTPIARMIEKGVLRIGKPLRDISVAIENVGKLEIYQLERKLATLASIAGVAPMIGFFGTVTGMIKAFYNIAKAGQQVNANMLAGGIYEAMITTAAGLAVGIIALIGYNLLVSLVEKVVHQMEATSVEFIDLLQDPA